MQREVNNTHASHQNMTQITDHNIWWVACTKTHSGASQAHKSLASPRQSPSPHSQNFLAVEGWKMWQSQCEIRDHYRSTVTALASSNKRRDYYSAAWLRCALCSAKHYFLLTWGFSMCRDLTCCITIKALLIRWAGNQAHKPKQSKSREYKCPLDNKANITFDLIGSLVTEKVYRSQGQLVLSGTFLKKSQYHTVAQWRDTSNYNPDRCALSGLSTTCQHRCQYWKSMLHVKFHWGLQGTLIKQRKILIWLKCVCKKQVQLYMWLWSCNGW